MSMMNAKPIGLMKMIDQGKEDDKIVAVHQDDPEYSSYNSLKELPKHRILEIKKFFEEYKNLEKNTVIVGKIFNQDDAFSSISASMDKYKAHMNAQKIREN